MGTCVERLPHSCGSRKGLQVFAQEDGSVDGFCFSCGESVKHPYGEPKTVNDIEMPKPKTEADILAEIAEIDGYPVVDLPSRRLRAAALDKFGVKVGLSESDGSTPYATYYPYTKDGKLRGYKCKILSQKRIFSVGDLKQVDLFGWEEAVASGSPKLIITEGEDDAIALSTILDRFTEKKYEGLKPAVVSLQHGANAAARDLTLVRDKIIKNFKEVVFCFDKDKPGELAVEQCMLVLPNAKTVELPAKDANACIIEKKQRAAFNAVTFNTRAPKNTRIIFGEDIHEDAGHPPSWGELTWPWDHIQNKTRGIRYGETIYIGAGVKMGKSDLLNELASHFIEHHKEKVFVAKVEEDNKKTYRLLAGKIAGRIFNDPKVEFDRAAYDKAGEVLKEKVAILDCYQHAGWETLKADIQSAASWGAKAVFIDPITNLTNGMDAGEANSKLAGIATDLAAMAKDLNIVIFIFCHLKAHDGNISADKRSDYYRNDKYIGLGNCAHEKGGDILSSQFAGSRAMMRSCNMMLGLEGNKDESLKKEIKNVRHLVLLEDREFGETGRFPIYWEDTTGKYRQA